MTHVPILLTVSAKYLGTFMSGVRHEQSTRRATSFTFAYGFSLRGYLLMVSETLPTSKMSVASVAGEANVGEYAGRARNAIATRLVTNVCYIAPTSFMTCITYVLFGHCACKVSYHVMSFDIIVE